MRKVLRTVASAAVVAVAVTTVGSLPASASAASATNVATGRHSYTGTIDGAAYRVETPDRWNGTLVVYSHGYMPAGFRFPGIPLANRPETETWLLDHGYALAASEFQNQGVGFLAKEAQHDQIALLDWFTAHVGQPRRTIATGQSMGAAIAVMLAERNPGRFAGVADMCGEFDLQASWNMNLDINFTVKTLLAPGQDIDLVHPKDPAASMQALYTAVQQATTTPEGRARLALAASFGDVTGWYSAHQPRPTELVDWILGQAKWIQNAYILGLGPTAHADLEAHAGGNPSSNVGLDYGRQLGRSSQRDVVLQAYKAAGLDVRDDLDRLAAAPRISADPEAVRYLYQYGVPRGTGSFPVVTLHTTGDGGATPDHERWYADQIDRAGGDDRLRQLFVERGMHCSLSASEEIVALQALFDRLDTGDWPTTAPARLNAAAAAFGSPYDLVIDLGTFPFVDAPMLPAFTRFTPRPLLRPSR